MPKKLVGTYASHADAMRVQRDLERAGVPGASIHVHDGTRHASTEPLPEDRGIAGFIRRMFSGASGDAAEIRKYEAHAEGGGTVVIVEDLPDPLVDSATTAMRTRGSVDVHDHGDDGGDGGGRSTGDRALDTNEVLATASGPERSILPNASTGWNTSRGGSPSTTGTIGHDPARPQGLMADAQGLGTGESRGGADRRTSAAADANDTAPDALSHWTASRVPGVGRAAPPEQ